jgi:hypothetical protein
VGPLIGVLRDERLQVLRRAARILVAWRGAGKLGAEDRALVLAERQVITRGHFDKPDHGGSGYHTDMGIEVEFPI